MGKDIESSKSGKDCGHNGCSLINTEGCCACLDKRPVTKSYELYVDGQGITTDSNFNARYRHYCPSCRSGMNLPHVWHVADGPIKDPIKKEQIRRDRYARRAAHREARAAARAMRTPLPPTNATASVSEQLKPEIPASRFQPVERRSLFGHFSQMLSPSTSRVMEQRDRPAVQGMAHAPRRMSVESSAPPGYLSVDVPDSAPPPYSPREGFEVSASQTDQKPDHWADDSKNDARESSHENKLRWWTFFRR
jgi:hypothetical protein